MTEHVSDLKVMKSAAGYYIGRGYYDEDLMPLPRGTTITQDMMGFPYSRESEYFPTESDAQNYLDQWERDLEFAEEE